MRNIGRIERVEITAYSHYKFSADDLAVRIENKVSECMSVFWTCFCNLFIHPSVIHSFIHVHLNLLCFDFLYFVLLIRKTEYGNREHENPEHRDKNRTKSNIQNTIQNRME